MPSPRGVAAILAKSASDVVILSSVRTPITRAYKGLLKDAYPEELLATVLRHVREHSAPGRQVDLGALIDDVGVGVVLSELGGSKAARMAMNHVGYAARTAVFTVNRACASSLQAVAAVAAQMRTGMTAVGVAAGMESMTRGYGTRAMPVHVWPALGASPARHARDCLLPMGLTSEAVAERYGVSRRDQDALAAESHRRAAAARAAGLFDEEIVPVVTRGGDGDGDGDTGTMTVARDDGIREAVTAEALAALKPAFKPGGRSTAGNSSQVSDGAAATLLMRRATAAQLGLSHLILGKFVSAVVVGCAPDEMGVGPALAIPKLLALHGLGVGDVRRWEINEAFASQALYCLRELGLEDAWAAGRVNPTGGAIALGHPLGATGARMTSTLIHGMRRDGDDLGVVSMCVGTGMGMAGLFAREP